MQGERVTHFSNIVITVARLSAFIRSSELRFGIRKSLESFIRLFLNQEKDGSVAQYINQREILSVIRELNVLIQQLRFLKLVPFPHFLSSQRAILSMQLSQINFLKTVKIGELSEERRPAKTKTQQPSLEGTKEKIFIFIKKFPRVRARDIVDEFSIFSQRTVKRSLKELARNGFIERFTENKAVYYSAR